jgi:O-antigen/teichoic acid export membrane protein
LSVDQADQSLAKPEKSRNLAHRASRAMFWNAVFLPVKTIVSLAVSVVVVRVLHLENYAMLTVVTSLLSTLGTYSDLGIIRALPRYIPEVEVNQGPRAVRQLILVVVGIKTAVYVVLIAVINIWSDYFIGLFGLGSQGRILLVFISILMMLGSFSDVTVQLLYTYFKQKITNILDLLNSLINPILTIAFVLAGWKVIGVLLALTITTVISVTLSSYRAWAALRDEKFTPRVTKPVNLRNLAKRFMSFSSLTYFMNISVYFYDLPFVILVLNANHDLVGVAIMGLAFKLARQMLQMLVVPLTGVQTPLFARVHAEGRKEALQTAYVTITKFLIFALIPAGVGMAIMSRNVLQLLYLQRHAEAVLTMSSLSETTIVAIVLIIFLFAESLISVPLNILMVYEKYRVVILTRLVAFLAIPLLFLLSPIYGVIGAAFAVGGARFLSRALSLVYLSFNFKLPFPTAFLARTLACTAAFAAVLVPLVLYLPVNYLSTAGLVVLGVAIFFGAFKLLGGFDADDKERIVNLKVPMGKMLVRFL